MVAKPVSGQRSSFALPGLLRAATVSILLLGAAGCGGSSGDFSGAPEVPEGFKTESLSGVSFAHPQPWNVETRPVGQGGMLLKVTAPEKVGSALPTAALVRSSTFESINGFDASLDARRAAADGLGDDRSKTKQEDVDVPGAERAILFSGKVSHAGERYDSYDLAILLKDQTGAFFLVETPVGTGAKAILDTFRLDDG